GSTTSPSSTSPTPCGSAAGRSPRTRSRRTGPTWRRCGSSSGRASATIWRISSLALSSARPPRYKRRQHPIITSRAPPGSPNSGHSERCGLPPLEPGVPQDRGQRDRQEHECDREEHEAHLEDAEPLADGDQEQNGRKEDRRPDVLVAGLTRVRALLEHVGCLLIQACASLEQGVTVLRHIDRSRRRVAIGERVRRQPGVERGSILEAEALLVGACHTRVAVELLAQPKVERRTVVDLFLAAPRLALARRDSNAGRRPIELRRSAVPERGLIPAPGGRDRNDGKQ